jgi:hypothetical protein
VDRRSIRSLTVATLLIAGSVAAPAHGLAASPNDGGIPGRAQLVSAGKFDAADVLQARQSTSGSKKDDAVREYVAKQAQQGRLVDATAVSVADIGGGTAAWEKGSRITELRVAQYSTNEGNVSGAMAELAIVGEEDGTGTEPAAVEGMGLAAASYSGGTRLASYCQTWTVSGNSVTACVQKFKPTDDGSSTRDYYAYNRYGTATGASAIPTDWKVNIFDMRSRPRAGTTTTKGMSGYFPNDSTQLCNEGGSVGLKMGSLNLTIPLTACGSKYPVPNATTMTMGLVYDSGFIFSDRVKGLDYEQEVWAYQGAAAPNLGFYNYGKFCYLTLLTCSGTQGLDGW